MISEHAVSLAPDHQVDLRNSGLSDETISRLQISTVRPHDIKPHILPGVTSAYRIPYFTLDGQVNGFERWKLFPSIEKDGHTQKYYQAKETDPHVYYPPLVEWRKIAQDTTATVVIAEGEKKAAKGCQEGLPALSIGGVWSWRTKLANGERLLLPELEQIIWKGRIVELVPDSDAWRSDKKIRDILSGFYALGMELTQRGATVRLVKLPEVHGIKAGLDDWLIGVGTLWPASWGHLERIELSDGRLKALAAWHQRWMRKQQRRASDEDGLFVKQVNAIRLDAALKTFERKREVAALVIEDLRSRGKLIHTREHERYFFDAQTKTLEPLDGDDFRAALYERFGLNSTEEETRFVERELVTMAIRRGEHADVYRLAYWNHAMDKLYIAANDGTLFVLDGQTITRQDNGTDGALFLSDRRADPIEPDENADLDAFHVIFDKLSLPTEDAVNGGTTALIKVWVLSTFFLEALPVRPILALIGPQGAGKTTLARRIGLILYGRAFDVGSFRSDATGEQDFLAAITARRFVAFDNAEKRIRWLPDHLAKLATGAEIERRRLYTTNELATFRPECFLAITSRDPRWKRDDVMRRLLPIRLETISAAKYREAALQREILQARPRIWSAMLTILNQVVAAIVKNTGTFTSSHRLADFHWFGSLAAPILGIGPAFEHAIATLDDAQLKLLGEGDDRLELLARWRDDRPGDWREESVTGAQLFEQLHHLHVGPDRNFPFKGVTALGSWLGKHKDLIESQLGMTVAAQFVGHARGWCFAETRCEGVKGANHQESKEILGSHTFTPHLAKTVEEESRSEGMVFEDAD